MENELSNYMYIILGMYFSSGSSKRRLDYYLLFLQSYYWFKKSFWGSAFPPTIDHIFKETLWALRPKFKLCKSYEEAQGELDKIRTSLGIGEFKSTI